MTGNILVAIPFNEAQKNKIKNAAGSETVVFKANKEVTLEDVRAAEVIMGNVNPDFVKQCPNVKWLQMNSAGANQFCPKGILTDDAILTSAVGAYNISVSENMVAGTLVLMKRVLQYVEERKAHNWVDLGDVGAVDHSNILILGLGRIGLAYAKVMKAMGAHIVGIKKNTSVVPEGIDEVHSMDELDECLAKADVVMCILPGTKDTAYLIGEKQLKLMKKTAILLNYGRGNSVDNVALCEALKAGEIAGASLDVTDPEPLPADHPLWDAPNLFLTPHVAGKFHIPQTLEIISDICAENLTAYREGKSLRNVVDREAGY